MLRDDDAVMICARCGQEAPDLDPATVAGMVWVWLHTPPGELKMTWTQLKAGANEYARSNNLLCSFIAAAMVTK